MALYTPGARLAGTSTEMPGFQLAELMPVLVPLTTGAMPVRSGAAEVVALDAAAYFSRPGPRLVDGLETLAHALHPDRVTEAPGRVHRVML